MTWQLRGHSQPRCGSGRMAAVWLRAPALCFLFTFLTCALQTGSQIDNRDNKIFGGFQNLQPKIYGDTIVMVVGYCLSTWVGNDTLPFVKESLRHENLKISHCLISFIFPVSVWTTQQVSHCQQQLQWIGYEIWTIILTHHQLKLTTNCLLHAS